MAALKFSWLSTTTFFLNLTSLASGSLARSRDDGRGGANDRGRVWNDEGVKLPLKPKCLLAKESSLELRYLEARSPPLKYPRHHQNAVMQLHVFLAQPNQVEGRRAFLDALQSPAYVV